MSIKQEDKTAAVLTIKDVDGMSQEDRKEIATWLRRQANKLVTARYLYRERVCAMPTRAEKQVSTRLDDETLQQVLALAKRDRISVTRKVRELVEWGLEVEAKADAKANGRGCSAGSGVPSDLRR